MENAWRLKNKRYKKNLIDHLAYCNVYHGKTGDLSEKLSVQIFLPKIKIMQ